MTYYSDRSYPITTTGTTDNTTGITTFTSNLNSPGIYPVRYNALPNSMQAKYFFNPNKDFMHNLMINITEEDCEKIIALIFIIIN